ncbi:hypothetical protein B9G39_20380 [Zooshikella ganghwensis]|uniref:Kazal-like domain-containing protein n=2 Tax=Zooshikella ganghwensis TaxID=202772 RepID=A0A4P9VQ15_9GAMM|nr:hypothetical protein B9G39_20380 [Zooshikella ganghwensis]
MLRNLSFIGVLMSICVGCGAKQPANYITCPESRPEACTRIYQPVCAERDTGVRCVTTPCDEAVEWVQKSNSCEACADEKVYGYYSGECAQPQTNTVN